MVSNCKPHDNGLVSFYPHDPPPTAGQQSLTSGWNVEHTNDDDINLVWDSHFVRKVKPKLEICSWRVAVCEDVEGIKAPSYSNYLDRMQAPI